ncbi:hypothetical protein M7I_7258 [Glarea lozoyensis 74030]|uniref:Uncharacterized protein n=1 Tax=Glarea lozoyensis (strain ATCC 74030 / MF5533) TaxID=1104152 RepID=H0EWT4_GLAL7|nr:hypothetical protein M7I_7258 [Glarea lozoyensis 74030]
MLFLEAAICLLSVTGLALAVTSPRSSEDVSIEDVKTGRVYHNVEEWMADMDEWIDMRKKDAEAEKDKIDPFSRPEEWPDVGTHSLDSKFNRGVTAQARGVLKTF